MLRKTQIFLNKPVRHNLCFNKQLRKNGFQRVTSETSATTFVSKNSAKLLMTSDHFAGRACRTNSCWPTIIAADAATPKSPTFSRAFNSRMASTSCSCHPGKTPSRRRHEPFSRRGLCTTSPCCTNSRSPAQKVGLSVAALSELSTGRSRSAQPRQGPRSG